MSDDAESFVLHHAPRSSIFASFSTTVKCIVGSGILSLPYAFYQSGWLAGIFGLSLVALLSYSTMSLIIGAVHLTRARLRRRKAAAIEHAAVAAGVTPTAIENGAAGRVHYGSMTPAVSSNSLSSWPLSAGGTTTAPATPKPVDPLDLSVIEADPDLDVIGYQQVAYVAFGECGRVTTDGVLIFCQLGSCAAFLVLILTNLQACLASYGVDWPLEPIALFLAPIVILLTLPRSTTYLAPAAHFGNMTLLVGVGTIVWYGMTSPTSHIHKAGADVSAIFEVLKGLPKATETFFGMLLFAGISAFAFAAHCEIVAVEADAKSRQTYQVVLPTSILFIAALYIFVSLYAYACFGSATKANILLNLGQSFFVNVVRIALSCTLLVNFALALFPASQTLDLLIAGPAPISLDVPHQHENTPRTKGRKAAAASAADAALVTVSEQASLLRQPKPHRAMAVLPPQWPEAEAHHALSGASPRDSPTSSPLPQSSPSTPSPARLQRQRELKVYHRKGNAIRLAVVLLTFTVGLLIQDLGVLFSLVGSVAGGILCFTMPPLYWWKLMKLEREPISIMMGVSLILQTIFGLTLVAMGIAVVFISAKHTHKGGA